MPKSMRKPEYSGVNIAMYQKEIIRAANAQNEWCEEFDHSDSAVIYLS